LFCISKQPALRRDIEECDETVAGKQHRCHRFGGMCGRTFFASHYCANSFLFSNLPYLGVRLCLEFNARRWSFMLGNIRRKLNLTAHFILVSSQIINGGNSLLQFNQILYLFYGNTETIQLAPVLGSNSRRMFVISDIICPSKSSWKFYLLHDLYI